MRDLEKTFERNHINNSVKIADASLKALFVQLMKGDQSHIRTLSEMIASLETN